MRKTLSVSIVVLTVLTMSFSLRSAEGLAAEAGQVVLKKMKGDVKILRTGQFQEVAATEGDLLSPGDKLVTGKGASAKIEVGTSGEIELQGNTTWSIENFSEAENVAFSSHLALGRLKAKLKALPPDSSFEIRTPTAVAAVRGTSFGLWVHELLGQLLTQLDVFENSVFFSDPEGDQGVEVGEGESYTANEEGEITPKKKPEGAGEEEVPTPTLEEKGEGIPGLPEEPEEPESEEEEAEEEEDQSRIEKG